MLNPGVGDALNKKKKRERRKKTCKTSAVVPVITVRTMYNLYNKQPAFCNFDESLCQFKHLNMFHVCKFQFIYQIFELKNLADGWTRIPGVNYLSGCVVWHDLYRCIDRSQLRTNDMSIK